MRDRDAILVLHVEAQAALAAVIDRRQRRVAAIGRAEIARPVALGRFDLDDVGAPVREDPTGARSCDPDAKLDNTYARLQFVEVTNESRCPLNAICIQAGDATIAVSVADDRGSSRYDLRINDPTRRSVLHRDLRVEFVDLRPYSDTNRPTAPGDYRAMLRVSR